jgi:putative phage-type endonuclease
MTLLASGTLITPANRDLWLMGRSSTLGASEIAAICGESRYASPLDVYLSKIGLGTPVEETMAMRLGTLLEPVICQLMESELPCKVEQQQVYARSLERPWMSCTIDAITSDGELQEYKTLGSRMAGSVGDEDTDEVPPSWILQATAQCYVAETSGLDVDFRRVRFGVLIAGQSFKTYMVERDEVLLAEMLRRCDDFWDRVQRRDPPPVSRASDAGLMHLLYKSDDGPEIAGDDELADLVIRYKANGAAEKEAKEAKDLAKAKILETMGEAGIARFADGSTVKRSIVNKKAYTVNYKPQTYAQIYPSKGKER